MNKIVWHKFKEDKNDIPEWCKRKNLAAVLFNDNGVPVRVPVKVNPYFNLNHISMPPMTHWMVLGDFLEYVRKNTGDWKPIEEAEDVRTENIVVTAIKNGKITMTPYVIRRDYNIKNHELLRGSTHWLPFSEYMKVISNIPKDE
ncbi:MAG: hypothetical protein J6Y37_14080 [Paludibacteraceae bacterium]|nr:hypothetical protein [Paludibacteraceae bacterium]